MASRLWIVLLALGLPSPLIAQWPTDAATDLALADAAGEQAIPKVAATTDGGCYSGWFDNASGNYDVYLQRLDASGTEFWPHGGILISDHPQNSYLVDWDLRVDSDGNCVLVFADNRNGGGDFDIYAYRIAPDGSFLWGPDGIAISERPDFEAAPRVAELSNGSFVFTWSRDPSAGDGKITAQVVDPAGAIQYPANGLDIAGDPGNSPAFCQVVAAEAGSYIVSYVSDISSFLSSRHIHAQKLTLAGVPAWTTAIVYDQVSIPIAHVPLLASDGAGGAVVAWHSDPGSSFNCRVQRLDSDGIELFPHNGVQVATDPSGIYLNPSLAYDATTEEIFVFFNKDNSAQSQFGISGQKFDVAGNRQWTDAGAEIEPVSAVFKSAPRSVLHAGGAMVFAFDQPTGFGSDRVIGYRVDGAGSSQWMSPPTLVASTPSAKGKLVAAGTAVGTAILVWEDDRDGATDIYAKAIGVDATLGPALPVGPDFDRGDCNADGAFNVADAVTILDVLFVTPGALTCDDACDTNDDGNFDISDAIATLSSLFVTGTPLPVPHGGCGTDPTDDALDCASFAPCP